MLFYAALLGGAAAQNAYVTTWVTTLAGNGSSAFADGTGTNAAFRNPSGVAVDASGNAIVVDSLNHRVRKVTPGGVITTLAGDGYVDGSGSGRWMDGPGTSSSF
jgi:hypothetical protein